MPSRVLLNVINVSMGVLVAAFIKLNQQLMLLRYIDAHTAVFYAKTNPVVWGMIGIVFIDLIIFNQCRVFIKIY